MVAKKNINYADLPPVLRIDKVSDLLDISTTKIYRELKRGTFQPAPIDPHDRPYRWRRSTVIDYLENPPKSETAPRRNSFMFLVDENVIRKSAVNK